MRTCRHACICICECERASVLRERSHRQTWYRLECGPLAGLMTEIAASASLQLRQKPRPRHPANARQHPHLGTTHTQRFHLKHISREDIKTENALVPKSKSCGLIDPVSISVITPRALTHARTRAHTHTHTHTHTQTHTSTHARTCHRCPPTRCTLCTACYGSVRGCRVAA